MIGLNSIIILLINTYLEINSKEYIHSTLVQEVLMILKMFTPNLRGLQIPFGKNQWEWSKRKRLTLIFMKKRKRERIRRDCWHLWLHTLSLKDIIKIKMIINKSTMMMKRTQKMDAKKKHRKMEMDLKGKGVTQHFQLVKEVWIRMKQVEIYNIYSQTGKVIVEEIPSMENKII